MNCATLGCPVPRERTRRSHCARCHRTFSGVTAFDRHQTSGGCQDPAERGLVQRPDGIWRFPGEWPGVKTGQEEPAWYREWRRELWARKPRDYYGEDGRAFPPPEHEDDDA